MAVCMCAIFVLVGAKLAFIQVFPATRYAAYGASQLLHTVVIPAPRGQILDRNGNVLAMSAPQTTVVADPYQITDPKGDAALLAPLLKDTAAHLQSLLSENSGYVYLAHQVDDATTKKIKALNLTGLTYENDPRRFQPNGSLVTNLIGTVGWDHHGQAGLEYQYDRVLSGHDGKSVVEKDLAGGDIPGGQRSFTPAQPGHSLQTTIDRSMQYATTQALAGEITSSHSKGGIAVVMDAKTGDILAMVNLVAGAKAGSPPVPAPSNYALTNVYEPGSVAKITTISGALQDHVITPTQRFTVPDTMNIAGTLFHDAEVHPTQSMSVSDILAQSSNIGTITIAKMLGKDRINHYLNAFGLGQPTGLNFPGESQGLLIDPSKWSGTAIGSVPIGQDESVTAVQMLDAYNTLANGGMFVAPRLIRAVVAPNGSVSPAPVQPPRRVIDASVAKAVTGMLEQVVKKGTGTSAAIPGYVVAGKTGTAQIPKTNGPGYQPGAFMATFAGFAPAQNPALSAIVVLDQPAQIYGGLVAAPLFANVVQYGLRLFDVPPSGLPAQATVRTPTALR